MASYLSALLLAVTSFVGPYVPQDLAPGDLAVDFDGTDDRYDHTSTTGFSDSKQLTVVISFKRDNDSTSHHLFGMWDTGASSDRCKLLFLHGFGLTGEAIIECNNSSGTVVLSAYGATDFDTAGWHTLLISVDLADTGKRHWYKENTSDSPTWATYTNDTMSPTTAEEFAIGSRRAATSQVMNGKIGVLWLDFGTYFDFSSAANRALFIDDTNGLPVDLGADGSKPTGSKPDIFLRFGDGSRNEGDTSDYTATSAPVIVDGIR